MRQYIKKFEQFINESYSNSGGLYNELVVLTNLSKSQELSDEARNLLKQYQYTTTGTSEREGLGNEMSYLISSIEQEGLMKLDENDFTFVKEPAGRKRRALNIEGLEYKGIRILNAYNHIRKYSNDETRMKSDLVSGRFGDYKVYDEIRKLYTETNKQEVE